MVSACASGKRAILPLLSLARHLGVDEPAQHFLHHFRTSGGVRAAVSIFSADAKAVRGYVFAGIVQQMQREHSFRVMPVHSNGRQRFRKFALGRGDRGRFQRRRLVGRLAGRWQRERKHRTQQNLFHVRCSALFKIQNELGGDCPQSPPILPCVLHLLG